MAVGVGIVQKRWLVRVCPAIAAMALVFAGHLAVAQTEPGAEQDAAIAEALFQHGRKAAQAERWDEACDKFEASLRLVRTLGTLGNLAWCHEKQGRTASAWALYRELEASAQRQGDATRATFAAQRLNEIETKVPRIRIIVEEPPKGLVIRLGGKTLERGAWNCAIPVDPGRVQLRAEAPSHEPTTWTVQVPITKGTRVTTVPKLRRARPRQDSSPRSKEAVGQTDRQHHDAVAKALASAAVVALGVGAYTGFLTFRKKAEGDDHCSGRYCDEVGLAAHDAAERYADAATVSVGIALAAGGASAWLFLSDQSANEGTGDVAGARGTMVQLGSRF